MATELVANSPTPGSRVAICTLAGDLSSSATAMPAGTTAPPAALQSASGQFRMVIDSEIIIGSYSAGAWGTLTRGAEGSTAAAHSSGASVYHDLTAGALQALLLRASASSVPVTAAGNVSGNVTIPAPTAVGAIYYAKVTGDSTFALPTPAAGQEFVFAGLDDGAGSLAHNISFSGTIDLVAGAFSQVTTPGALNEVQFICVDATKGWQLLQVTSGVVAGQDFYGGLFGDGSDGAAVLDGKATVSWATLTNPGAAGVYTMTSDANCTDFTLNAGITLATNGWRFPKCQGTATIAAGAIVTAAGGSASGVNGSAAGVASASNTVGGGIGGKAGGTGAGTAGTAGTVGGASGSGGSGSSGAGGAGANPLVAASALPSIFKQSAAAVTGTFTWAGNLRTLTGGGGGGSGAGDGTNPGGAGGAGGGVLPIFAHALVNNGTITVAGGNGGTPTIGNCGGGGAGAGGSVLAYTLVAITGTGTVNVAGGTGGAGVGTGTSGANGTAGTFLPTTLK